MSTLNIILISLLVLSSIATEGFAGTIKGKVSSPRLKSPNDVLVYIDKVETGEFSLPPEPAKMDQKNLVFTPRVLPVVAGTTVEFHNSDDLKHNVFGVGDYDFDLGTWTKGIVKNYTFDKLGEVAILCNVHPEMEAYIVVLQNPYFALTDKEGDYKIENIPAGTYTLKTWHDRLRSVEKEIEVPQDGEIVVDFELKR
jgi:plastocyanin